MSSTSTTADVPIAGVYGGGLRAADDPGLISRLAQQIPELQGAVLRAKNARMERIQNAYANPAQARGPLAELRAQHNAIQRALQAVLDTRYPSWRADLDDDEREARHAVAVEMRRVIREAEEFIQQ